MKVLVTDEIAQTGLARLQELPGVELVVRTKLSESELLAEIADATALLVRSQTVVTERVIEAAARLRVIGRAGVGVDNIDVSAATRRGIIVVNAPDGNTISAAEHTLAMLLALSRNIPQADASVKRGEWKRSAFTGVELRDKVLSVIGMGRIGTEVAKRAIAFGMHVCAYDPYLTDERARLIGVRRTSLDEAITAADFITLHTPLVKETHHLIGTDAFRRMKRGVRIVNCARGGIIDEAALVDALASGTVAGAALDVYETEPFPVDHPLRAFPQVILTPHIAASTAEAQTQVAITVATEVANILQGKPFTNAVNLPSLPAEQADLLKPYLELCEQLGLFIGQLCPADLERIEVKYMGDVAEKDVSLLTRTVLKGLFSRRYVDEVNYVNAPVIAREAGITVQEVKLASSKVYTSAITLTVQTPAESRTVTGTLYNGSGPRIVEVDGYRIDVQPHGILLYTQHIDRPGMIGRIGTLLGAAEVNIASMQVGRQVSGGKAVMLLAVDRPIPDDVLQSIARVEGIFAARVLEL